MNSRVVLALVACFCLAADAPSEEAKKELAKLKGNWTVTSYEREGRKLGEDEAKKIKFSFMDDKLTLTAGIGFTGGKEGALKLDPTQKPKTIDLTPADGRNKDKIFEGIYILDGDTLKMCLAAPGEKRPTEFTTKAGSKSVLVVYQRDKP